MVEVFKLHGNEVIDFLSDKLADPNVPIEQRKKVEVQDLFQKFTLDSIGKYDFSTNFL